MKNQFYFPKVKNIDIISSPIKNDNKNSKNKGNSSNNTYYHHVRNSSEYKEITSNINYNKICNEVDYNDQKDYTKINGVVDFEKKESSPLLKSNKFRNLSKSTKFIEFKNNAIKSKSNNHLNTSSNLIQIHNKSDNVYVKPNNKSSTKLRNEADNFQFENYVNTEFNVLVDNEKSNFENLIINTKLEINTPEELHFFYNNILKHNKKLVYKFENVNRSTVKLEEDSEIIF